MKSLLTLLALASLTPTALAQPGDKTYIDIKARLFGTSDPFVDALSFVHPDHSPITLEVACFYYRNDGIGLATVVHNIVGSPFNAALGDAATILDDNNTSTLHPDGRTGNFNFGGQLQVVYVTGTSGIDANRFRIAANGNASDAPAGGISVKQNNPLALGVNFNGADGVEGYHFKLTVGCPADDSSRTMTIDAPLDHISSYRAYMPGGESIDIMPSPTSPLDTDPATITIAAPAPATLPLLLLGSAALARRRR